MNSKEYLHNSLSSSTIHHSQNMASTEKSIGHQIIIIMAHVLNGILSIILKCEVLGHRVQWIKHISCMCPTTFDPQHPRPPGVIPESSARNKL